MNFDDFPKPFKISQLILLVLLYVILCVVAVGSRPIILVALAVFILASALIALVHYQRKESFVSISNLCFAGVLLVVLVLTR